MDGMDVPGHQAGPNIAPFHLWGNQAHKLCHVLRVTQPDFSSGTHSQVTGFRLGTGPLRLLEVKTSRLSRIPTEL